MVTITEILLYSLSMILYLTMLTITKLLSENSYHRFNSYYWFKYRYYCRKYLMLTIIKGNMSRTSCYFISTTQPCALTHFAKRSRIPKNILRIMRSVILLSQVCSQQRRSASSVVCRARLI